MRILIFSDTHGYTDSAEKQIKLINKVDAIIHAGDYDRDASALKKAFPSIPVYGVRGNNELYSKQPLDLTVKLGGKTIYITHGHLYRVKQEVDSYSSLRAKAAEENADLCVFGHTHYPNLSYHGKLTLLNPGSITYSFTYAIAEIENGKLGVSIMKLI